MSDKRSSMSKLKGFSWLLIYRTRALHMDDTSVLSRRQRLYHHVGSDESPVFSQCHSMERGSGFQSMAARWFSHSLPSSSQQSKRNWIHSRSEYFYISIENLSFFGFSSLQCDLKDRQVDLEEIEKLYNKMNFIGWTETSAKVITQCNLDRSVTDTGLDSLYNATKARICLRLRRMVE